MKIFNEIFKIITSILLIALILFLAWLLIIGFAFNYNDKDSYIKFFICSIIFIIFLILTINFIIQKKYNIVFILSYFIIILLISYSILSKTFFIKYIPLVLCSIYMLLNKKESK